MAQMIGLMVFITTQFLLALLVSHAERWRALKSSRLMVSSREFGLKISTCANPKTSDNPAPVTMRISPSSWRVLGFLLGFKALYWLLVFICLAVFPRFENGHYDNCLHYPREGPPTLASQLATWDAAHYLLLAESGYQRGSPSCAFYPL